ncbi:MAG: O-antigen ligase family protein [Thermoanaerobaculia bacterium]
MSSASLPASAWSPTGFAEPRTRPAASPSRKWGIRLVFLTLLIWPIGFVAGIRPAVMALTMVGFAAAVGGLKSPSLGMLGIGLLCTLEPLTNALVLIGTIFRWNTLNYWLVLIIVLNGIFLIRRNDLQTRLLEIWLAVICLGLIHSTDFNAGVQEILEIVVAFGLLVYLWKAAGTDDEIWLWMAYLNATVAAVGGLVFFVVGADLVDVAGASDNFNRNAWAYLPVVGLFSICLGISRASRKGQLVLAALGIVNAGWVFMVGSRGGAFVGLICLPYLLAQMKGNTRRAIVLADWAAIGAAVYVSFHDRLEHSFERISILLDKQADPRARTSGRSDLVLAGWRIFQEHPVFGVGSASYPYYWLRMRNGNAMTGYGFGIERPAHSGWIRTLAENGLVGFTFHALYVLSFAVVGWRKRREGLFPLGLLVTAALAIAYISIEMQAKGLWFLAISATVLFHHPTAGPRALARRRARGGSVSPGHGAPT